MPCSREAVKGTDEGVEQFKLECIAQAADSI